VIPRSSSGRGPRALAVLGLCALLAGCAGQPTGTPVLPTADPTATAARGELPPPTRTVLPNGLRLIYQDHRASDIVAVYLWVGVGVRYEKPDELGYAHFQEHMLFKGTDKWGPGYIDRAVEGVGGRSNAVTSFDYTTFYIVVPREATETAIQLLHDMAFRSAFDPAEIGRERDVIFEESRIETDNPRTAIIRQLYGMVFEGHPYGRPVLGVPATMNAATHDRLKAFNQHYYTPENMALVVAGPVEEREVRAMVDRTFGRVPRHGYTTPPVPAPKPIVGVKRRDVERPEQQALLAMGWAAPRSDDPDGYAIDLLASILAGTESSRLAKRLRDEERIVTGITMSYAALVAGGIVSLRAELEAKDLARAEQIILEEVARIQESGPTEEERQLAVTKFESEHAFSVETSEGLANAYGVAETTWVLEEELRYVERLRQITREQIRDAARRYLSRQNYARLAFLPRKER
jgi:zinc protease